MIIGKHNTENKVFIIAEIGNNHEGDFNLAKEMICAAVDTGVDAVKFQTIVPELLVNKINIERFNKLKSFQFSYKQFEKLSKFCDDRKILFCSTPFDIKSAIFLNNIQSFFKISSGDNEFYPLIDTICKFHKPIILSTGLINLTKVKKIVSYLLKKNKKHTDLALLHCVSSYPTQFDEANINSIISLKQNFNKLTIGYSDHTLGIDAAYLSVACGARIIEKHFTIDKNYSNFRDHKLSANPKELSLLVKKIRIAEKLLGINEINIQVSEKDSIIAYKRSIASNKAMKKGKKISKKDLIWIRPGSGYFPGQEDKIIGKTLKTNIKKSHIFSKKDFK